MVTAVKTSYLTRWCLSQQGSNRPDANYISDSEATANPASVRQFCSKGWRDLKQGKGTESPFDLYYVNRYSLSQFFNQCPFEMNCQSCRQLLRSIPSHAGLQLAAVTALCASLPSTNWVCAASNLDLRASASASVLRDVSSRKLTHRYFRNVRITAPKQLYTSLNIESSRVRLLTWRQDGLRRRRMASSGMLRRMALITTDVSEEVIASIIRRHSSESPPWKPQILHSINRLSSVAER
jgi:hypothetical protein